MQETWKKKKKKIWKEVKIKYKMCHMQVVCLHCIGGEYRERERGRYEEKRENGKEI